MSLTLTMAEQAGRNSAPVFHDVVSFPGETSYTTGGSSFASELQALVKAGRNIMAVVPVDCGGYVPAYDDATGKLKFYYGDNNNAADGPLICSSPICFTISPVSV